MDQDASIRTILRKFVLEELLSGDSSSMVADDASFIESSIIDSTGVLEVVSFLEETFGIRVEDREMLPENLDSIDNLAGFVTRKQHVS